MVQWRYFQSEQRSTSGYKACSTCNSFFPMINILTWNCRGIGNRKFFRAIKRMCKVHNPDILCLLETHSSSTESEKLPDKLGFSNNFCVPSEGFSGGSGSSGRTLVSHFQFFQSTINVSTLVLCFIMVLLLFPLHMLDLILQIRMFF